MNTATPSSRFCLIATSVLLLGMIAPALAVTDNFDRVDSTNLGANWTENNGDTAITGTRATGDANSLMTYVGTSFTTPKVEARVYCGAALSYGALVARYASLTDNVFVKVQGVGTFTDVYFYYGNNAGGWPGMTGGPGTFALPTPFAAADIALTVVGDQVTLLIDKDFDGVFEESFTRGGLPLAALGKGTGLGFFGPVEIDNFEAIDNNQKPELKVTPKPPTATFSGFLKVKGTATDVEGSLDRVEFKVNRGPFRDAKGTTAWRLRAALLTGRNLITIRAVDSEGKASLPKRVRVTRL
jgi:hypothetical protein